MTWLERKDNWISGRGGPRAQRRDPQPVERSYSISEVAEVLSVCRQTVFKWLIADEENGEAVIPASGWYKLPGSGHIRIREWVLKKLQSGV